MGAFEQLHPSVQEWLYRKKWSSLREIQVEAIARFVDSDQDLIIAAPTAGGKTEAAFLPVCSAIAEDWEGSFRAIYVGPLRALINDQFRRMEELCGGIGIPVHRWHGDVGQAARRKSAMSPSGILLITPESIESILINRSSLAPRMFSRLETIVIDELHVFPGTERGLHLRSLLRRLELLRGARVRRIGLSATLGAPDEALVWLRPSAPTQVAMITQTGGERSLQTQVRAYYRPGDGRTSAEAEAQEPEGASRTDESTPGTAGDDLPLTDDAGRPLLGQCYADVFEHHQRGVNLIFANAKRQLEEAAPVLRAAIAARGIPDDRIIVHHGSLSREMREEAETMLQQGGDRLCFCSATLELGLDVGDVRAVGHLGAPWSAASAAQRLGRSGRRNDEPIFRQYIVVDESPEGAGIGEHGLHLELIRAIALIELVVARWSEPLPKPRSPITVWVQQVLSVIAQHNGRTAAATYQDLVHADGLGPLPTEAFLALLRAMGQAQLIEQLGNGELVIGRAGEELVNSLDFYALFRVAEEWVVQHHGSRIGTIPVVNAFFRDDTLSLGGRTWRVTDVDDRRRHILVEPARGRRVPLFTGERGDMHDRVIAEMRTVLSGQQSISFLDRYGGTVLDEARAYFAQHRLGDRRWTGGTTAGLLWTWRGSRFNATVSILLRAVGAEVDANDVSIAVAGVDDVEATLVAAAVLPRTALVDYLLIERQVIAPCKYDAYVPPELLVEQFLGHLDLDEAQAFLHGTNPGMIGR